MLKGGTTALDGYDFDYVYYDEQSEFPPRGVDIEEFRQKLNELAEKLGETISLLGEYLQRAFAPLGDSLRALADDLAGMVPKKRQVFKPVKMLGILYPRKSPHRELIPYYTGGFR